MYVHKTPPTPPQSNPFPGLNLKVGKMNYRMDKMDPNWAKCLKSRQNASRSVQKHFIHNEFVENITGIDMRDVDVKEEIGAGGALGGRGRGESDGNQQNSTEVKTAL